VTVSGAAGGSSSSWTATEAVALVAETVQPLPALSVTVTVPWGSSAWSPAVAAVTPTVPAVGTVRVRAPTAVPWSPVAVTVATTVSGAVGGGVAVIVNAAAWPSVTAGPAVTATCGTAAGGVGVWGLSSRHVWRRSSSA